MKISISVSLENSLTYFISIWLIYFVKKENTETVKTKEKDQWNICGKTIK